MQQDRQSTGRDAALHRLSRINRTLIAASIIATGLLTDVAAHAFQGKTTKSASTTSARHSLKQSTRRSTSSPASPSKTSSDHASSSKASSDSLRPPAQAPAPTTSQEASTPVISGGS
jgi:cytoskeletal protein RodZ